MQQVLDSVDLTTALKFHNMNVFVTLLTRKCEPNILEPTSHCSSSFTTYPEAHGNSYEVKAFYCSLWEKLEQILQNGGISKISVPPSPPQWFWTYRVGHTSFQTWLFQEPTITLTAWQGLKHSAWYPVNSQNRGTIFIIILSYHDMKISVFVFLSSTLLNFPTSHHHRNTTFP